MAFDKLYEKFICVKEELKSSVLDFRVDEVELPDGRCAERRYIKHRGAVAVLPIDNDGNVYLVNQYRYPAGRVTTELPAGKLDSPDEDRLGAAMRELREETGFTSGKVTFIGEYLGSPAINTEIIWLYLAENLSDGEQKLDEDEFLNVVKMPLSELVSLVMEGKISDGKTAYAALWADKFLSQREQ